jgi:hypothetical protein
MTNTADATHPIMALLRAGVPLSLLLDLAGATPGSQAVYDGEPADTTWVPRAVG